MFPQIIKFYIIIPGFLNYIKFEYLKIFLECVKYYPIRIFSKGRILKVRKCVELELYYLILGS